MSDPQRCSDCPGTMRSSTVPYYYEADGRRWLFARVPALVCDLCGRTTFWAETVARVQSIILDGAEPTDTGLVPLYDWATFGRGTERPTKREAVSG